MGKHGNSSHHQGHGTQQSPQIETYKTYYDGSRRPYWYSSLTQPPQWGALPALSGTAYGGPSQPQASAESTRYNIGTEQGFNSVPKDLLKCTVSKVFVEFLTVSLEDYSEEEIDGLKNHATFKFDFKHAWDGYKGARLSMDLGPMDEEVYDTDPASGKTTAYTPGDLVLKPVTYKEQSRSAVRLIQLELTEHRSLRTFILTLAQDGLCRFNFVDVEGRFFGCRDWMIQATHCVSSNPHKLVTAKIKNTTGVGSLPNGLTSAYDALGLRFHSKTGRARGCPIDYGHFPDHDRVASSAFPYVGSARAERLVHKYP